MSDKNITSAENTVPHSTSIELLYVWVETDETGFIQKQGFNLSPDYRFEMTPVGNGETYELSCKCSENDFNVWKNNHILNLTAVVGENGSGKSTLLRDLLCSPLRPNERNVPVPSSLRRSGGWSKMVKIYRYDGEIKIYHNFSNGEIIDRTGDVYKNKGNQGSLISSTIRFDQTRIYLTNGLGALSLVRESIREQNCVCFSPDENNALSRSFFEKTANAFGLSDSEAFVYLQKKIAGHNRYKDFEQLVTVSYYHDLLLQEKDGKGLLKKQNATCSPIIYVTLNEPYTWFKDANAGKPYAPDATFTYLLSETVNGMKDWNSWNVENDPLNAIYMALAFELDYFVRYLVNNHLDTVFEAEVPHVSPETYAQILLTAAEQIAHKDDPVVQYYKNAVSEIDSLRQIWRKCQSARPPRNNRYGIVINRDTAVYEEFCAYIYDSMRKKSSFVLKYLRISMPPRSSGEQALQNVFSWLKLPPSFEEIFGWRSIPMKDNILLLLDEVDLYMHPEWQRQLLNMLSERLSLEFPGKSIQVIISTHSPLVLSDVPSRNIIYLEQNDGNCSIAHGPEMGETFGANLFSLLRESFFLKKSLGEYAFTRIDAVIKDLNDLKDALEKPDNAGTDIEKLKGKCRKHEGLINTIGEPVIRRKLEMLYRDVFHTDEMDEYSRCLAEFNRLWTSDDPGDKKKFKNLLKIMGSGSDAD